MDQSRRSLIQGDDAGLAALATFQATGAYAETATPASVGNAAAGRKLEITNFDLLETEARKAMGEAAYAFIVNGPKDEWTLRENRRAFDDYPVDGRCMVGFTADEADLNVEVLGQKLPFPIMVAPMGTHVFAYRDGEVVAATSAGGAGATAAATLTGVGWCCRDGRPSALC